MSDNSEKFIYTDLSTEERNKIEKLLEDPYAQYLIKMKAESSTRTFLKWVGSIILLIILYAGYEFKSAKDEIRRNKDDFQSFISDNKKAIGESVSTIEKESSKVSDKAKEIEKNAQEVEENVLLVQKTTTIANTSLAQTGILLNSSTSILKDTEKKSFDLLKDARENLSNSYQSLQNSYTQASAMTDKVSQAISNLDIPTRLREMNTYSQTAEQARTNADIAVSEAKLALRNITPLQDVNNKLLKTQTSEFFLLRQNRQYAVTLPDISAMLKNSATIPRYKITFSTKDIGKGFKFTMMYKVEIADNGEIVTPWEPWFVDRKPEGTDDGISIVLKGTPFKAVLSQTFSGFFSPEFVIIKVIPNEDKLPKIEVANNEKK